MLLTAGGAKGRGHSDCRWRGPSSAQEEPVNKSQVKGRAEQAGGKIKEVAGKATGDKDLEAEGRADKDVGKLRSTAGDVKEDIKRTVRKATR